MSRISILKYVILFSVSILVFQSCETTSKLPSNKSEKGSPTFIKNGTKYESYVADSPPPQNYNVKEKPNQIQKTDLDTSNWKFESYNGRISSDQGSVSYSFYNEKTEAYFNEISKKNIVEIQMLKKGSKGCKVKNYKFSIQSQKDRTPMAIAFVLDHSGSMGDDRASIMQAQLDSALALKHVEDEISIIKFDNFVSQPTTSKDLNIIRNQVRPTYGLSNFGRATAIQDALHMALETLASSKIKDKQIILITDGCENSSSFATNVDSLLQHAKKLKIAINTIGFGQYVDENYLRNISNQTGGYYDNIYKTEEFQSIFNHIYHRINNNFKISFTPCMFGDSLILKTTLKKDNLIFNHEKMYFNDFKIGESIELNVLFDKDKYAIKPEFESELNDFVDFMLKYPNLYVELGGHTDSDGDEKHNETLSKNRALAIRNYVVKKGIPESRITCVGYGELKPKYPNDSPENMYLNRRTEAKITKF
jgi:outer membrane protein OmpA-like peptidoglycan-associated protein